MVWGICPGKDGKPFRSEMTVIEAGSQENAEAQLIEQARAQVQVEQRAL